MDTQPPESIIPSKSPAELALEIYNLLLPHPSEVRVRAVQSAMTSLGENPRSQLQSVVSSADRREDPAGDFTDLTIGQKALRWAQKNGVAQSMLDEVFHLSGGSFEIIASSVPGASKREMTVNCYLLVGLAGLLRTDTPSIEDSEAISLCKRLTAYDKNNHTTHRLAVGNKMTGTKPNFSLTGPGETAAAELVKQMSVARNG